MLTRRDHSKASKPCLQVESELWKAGWAKRHRGALYLSKQFIYCVTWQASPNSMDYLTDDYVSLDQDMDMN